MSNKENSIKVKEGEMEVIVTEILSNIGIPRHLTGFYYIRRAILISLTYKSFPIAITKVLYPEVAKEFETTPSRVERAMRHAIEVAWVRGDYEYMDKLFVSTVSSKKGKPTNAEFISLVTDKLRLEMK